MHQTRDTSTFMIIATAMVKQVKNVKRKSSMWKKQQWLTFRQCFESEGLKS